MHSFIYASTAMSVVTERHGRTVVAGMNLLCNGDPASPRFDGGSAVEQPRCRLDSRSRCLRTARGSSCRLPRDGESKRHPRWYAGQAGIASGSASGA